MLSSALRKALQSSTKSLEHHAASFSRTHCMRGRVFARSFATRKPKFGQEAATAETITKQSTEELEQRHISTFYPDKYLGSDRIPFTSLLNITLGQDSTETPNEPINLLPGFKMDRLSELAASQSGFLYFHTPKDRPSTASELRFRVTSGITRTDFEQGFDFLMPNQIPWSLPIWRIVKCKRLAPIKEQLLRDGIVTSEYIEHCDRLFPQIFETVTPKQVIYSLRQSFPVHVYRNKISLWVVGEDKVLDIHIGASFLGYPPQRQKLHYGVAMVELDFDKENGVYVCRVVREAGSRRPPGGAKCIQLGKEKALRCYSYTTENHLPVLKEMLGT